MKKLKTLLYGFFAAAMIAGCSQDEIPGNGTDTPGTGENDGEGYYTSLNILMPNGKNMSRSVTTDPDGNGSSTSSDGIEVGSEAENKVTSALIVLAKYAPGNAAENFGFIAAAEVQSSHLVDMTVSGDKAYKALARIQKTNLSLFYDQLEGNGIDKPIVYVFVFCNPTKDLSDMFTSAHTTYGDTNWINSECVVRQGGQG
ncbi:MAG: hypothetical protein K2F61_00025, partial [Muribaculaceae bacterium]|nr:hypothetical protein [Muribaculaceae bacterium]